MKVLHISTYDKGGAGIACIRSHTGLLEINIESKVLLLHKSNSSVPFCYQYERPTPPNVPISKRIYRKARRILHKIGLLKNEGPIDKVNRDFKDFLAIRNKKLEMISSPFSNIDITEHPLYKEADIIHLHWVAFFLDFPVFFRKNIKPVVWTLHDQAPFLGGEHYVERFLGIDNNGKPLQRIYTDKEILFFDKYLNIKKESLKQVRNLNIVATSSWMLNQSKESLLFCRFSHYLIPCAFKTNIFKPLDKNFCRHVLNIPLDKKVLLFVADELNNYRKGYDYLKLAMADLPPDILICAVGSNSQLEVGSNMIELGKIPDERLLAIVYNAADIFVMPSLEEAFGQTAVEALLCGIPVIGFPVGGITDIVVSNFNGYLVPEISASELRNAINDVIQRIAEFDAAKISEDAKARFELSKQAFDYSTVYGNILNETASN